MKKNILILVILSFFISLTSCKNEIKKAAKAEYSIEPATTTINWTAYKTTEKIPVSGVFKTVNVTSNTSHENPNDVINGLEFSVPVNSIDTKNADRDAKIINSFFGSMKDTQVLKGKIHLGEKGKGTVDLTMNGITKSLPMTYIISGQLAEIEAKLDLSNWQSQLAINALNKVCNEKHKGKDGISKTWNEVAIHIVSYMKVK